MSTTELDPILEEARSAHILDADFHIVATVEDLLPYVSDDRIKKKLERGHPPTPQIWKPTYSYAGQGVEDTSGETGSSPTSGYGQYRQGEARDTEEVLEVLDEYAVDGAIVTSNLNAVSGIQHPVLKTEICRAFNDFMLDKVTDRTEDIYGQLMLPQWNPEAMVEELDRLGDEKEIAGAYGWYGPNRLLGEPSYDQVYEKLTSLGLPLALHGSGVKLNPFTPRTRSLRTYSEMIGLAWPFEAMYQLANMVFTGVFDAYPELNVLSLEAGTSWVPFFSGRLDEEYELHPDDLQVGERMYANGQTHLEKMPSEYVRDNMFFGTQPIVVPGNYKQYEAMLEMSHASETFVFATDWPHFSFDTPNWAFENPAIDADLRKRIFADNALELFRMK